MKVRLDGMTYNFPDDATDEEISSALEGMTAPAPAAAAEQQEPEPAPLEVEAARIRQERASKPTVPLAGGASGHMTPEEEAASIIEGRERKAVDKAAYEARTPVERTRDTAAFLASIPVRMATRGEYGVGDLAGGLGYEETARKLQAGERDFAWANEPGLRAAAAAGDTLAGVPMLSTMGAVPGQVMRAGATSARDLPRQARALMRQERGTGPIGGGPRIPQAAPTTADDIAAVIDADVARGARPPSRNDIIAAGERINERMPEGERFNVVPRAVAGNAMERGLAGGLEAIPYVGAPVTNALEKGLYGLGRAKEVAAESMGAAGEVGAGSAIRSRVADWMKRPTALDEKRISEMYDEVGKSVKGVPVNLQNLKNLQRQLRADKARSTTKEHDAALTLIDDMLDPKQFPQGMPYKDLLTKRKEIGARTSGKIVNEAGTSQVTLDRIYGAMTEDLKFAIRRGGGRKALEKWEEANTAAQNVADQRAILQRLVGESGEVPPEKIMARIKELGKSRRGDITVLRILKRILPEEEFGDMAATMADDLGKNVKGDFTLQRFTSDYGRYSEAAKRVIFGEGKDALDDIALVAKRFEKLPINTSKTGVVNAVLQLLTNPIAVLGAGAAIFTDIGTVGAAGATAGGFRAGRSMAWSLSKPAVAREASKVFRAYYNVMRAGPAIASREVGLTAAIRSYSMALAAETGGNADEIERAMTAKMNQIRRKEGNKN